MDAERDDLKSVLSTEISFHEALQAILSIINVEPALSNHVHCFPAQGAEQLRKAAAAIETALGAEPWRRRQSETALDLLKTLVHDLSAFDSEDPISGAELVDYMANFYESAKSLVRQES